MIKLREKGTKLQQALTLVQFIRECDEVMFWIHDKEAFVTSEESGQDLEHVEVLQKKFDEFNKDLQNHEDHVTEVNNLAQKLIDDQHPEEETITRKRNVSTNSRLFILHFQIKDWLLMTWQCMEPGHQ